MTKKLLLILCMFMLVFVGGCNSTTNIEDEVEEETPTEEIRREVINSLEYEIAPGLPTIKLDEQFIKINLTDEDKENDMQAAFESTDGRLMIVVYRYKKNDYTLQGAVDALIDTYYNNQDLVGSVFNNFKGSNCNYGYFMAYDDHTYYAPYYIQTYIFEDGEDFVEVDYWHNSERTDITDGIYFDLPYTLMQNVELTKEDKDNGAVLRYESTDGELADVCFYKKKTNEKDYNALLKQYKKDYNVIEAEEYSYEEDGTEYNNLYIKYESNRNGSKVTNYEFISLINGAYYSVDYEARDLYSAISIPSTLFSINSK